MIDDFKPAPSRAESLPGAIGSHAVRQIPIAKPNFLTPDQVAAEPVVVQPKVISIEASFNQQAAEPKHPHKLRKFALQWPPNKREAIVGAVVVLLIVSGIASFALTRHGPKPVAAAAPVAIAKPKPAVVVPTTVPSDLTGLPVSPSINSQPVTAVMIENSTFARPQSGLSAAGVVFEAVAEGGVTRFMALYQDTAPANVGPIRSLRPYYLQWALGFNASIAHVGGSPDALADLKTWDGRDLDEFYNGSYYHRITTRDAPHNVYTAIATLNQLEAKKGYSTSTFMSWPRKPDAPATTPTARSINITLSGADYNVNYTYDAATNSYNRAEGGAAQTDANTNTQLSPKIVITMVVPETQGALDSSGAYYSDYNPIGTGAATIFQDGTVTAGQWSKPSNTAQLSFISMNGQPIKLNAGQTWITAITSPSKQSYTP